MKHSWDPFGFLRLTDESHTCFSGSSSSLLVVAFETAGYYVAPGLSAAFDYRYDVVERKVLRRATLAAVLASMLIACINIGTTEFYMLISFANPDISQ